MRTLITLLALLIFTSCTIRPEPIVFGEDSCHSCSMTIVDRQHAAEIVTKKGKVYKFDAAECMIRAIPEWGDDKIGMYLVTDYAQPGKLVDAEMASFVVSPKVTSPMRANLCAMKNSDRAKKLQQELEGNIYSWEEIQHHLAKN